MEFPDFGLLIVFAALEQVVVGLYILTAFSCSKRVYLTPEFVTGKKAPKSVMVLVISPFGLL